MPIGPGTRLGPYEILVKVGEGGMGEVYRARHARLERDVAVKVLPEHLAGNAAALARFEREAKAIAALSHPNILAIHDFGTEEGVSFAVMELLQGETLRQRVAAAPLPWRKAVEIGVAIAEGLAAAHAKGIVHRDLKPENLFITADGHVKILDFGLARLAEAPVVSVLSAASTREHTTPGTVLGTTGYMSPEQARGDTAGPPSDIFSLGCVLHEMLTGKRTFARGSAAEALAAILKEDPPPPSASDASIPLALDTLVRHCLEKAPGERFQSTRDLAFALRAVLTGSGPAAKQPEDRYGSTRDPAHDRKDLRRGRRGLVALGVVVLLGAGLWLWRPLAKTGSPPGSAETAISGALPGRIERLAVLPLENLSHDPQQDYFADGMTDELTTALARTGALQVISRTSVMQYKGARKLLSEIARELNADAVIEGSVLRSGDRVRITAQLIHAPTDRHLWAESYERDVRDVLVLQSEVAQAIARQVQVTLKPEARSRLESAQRVNREAYETYLKGSSACDGDLLAKAIQLDPSFGPAHAAVADCTYIPWLFGFVTPADGYSKMKDAAARALEKDEGLAKAHGALALARLHYDWDLVGSEREFRRALELNPNDADLHHMYAHYLLTTGRSEESLAETQRAADLDPVDAALVMCVGWHSLFARQYDKAIDYELKAIGMEPNMDWAHLVLGWAYEQKKMYPEAIAAFRKGMETSGGAAYAMAALAHGLGISGKKPQAQELLARLNEQAKHQYLSPYSLAAVYLGLGDNERALGSLQKAFEERTPYLVHIGWDPRFDTLHREPRFRDLIRRIGLPI